MVLRMPFEPGNDLKQRIEEYLLSLNNDTLRTLITSVLRQRIESETPSEALKFLFQLDMDLYAMEGGLSVKYDGGLHTKHRHTKYHDFFINRIQEGQKVLDIGCGIGILAYDLITKKAVNVTAIDFSESNIAMANERYSHPLIEFVLGDALVHEFKNGFDVVILSNVLEHIENRDSFLKQLVEKISPEKILIRVPLFERDWRVPLKRELGLDYRLDETHYIEYTPENFYDEMKRANLNIVEKEFRWGEIWAVTIPEFMPNKRE